MVDVCLLTRFYRAILRRARLCYSMSSVRLFVSVYVTFRYRDHIGWNTSKIISKKISLRFMLKLTTTWTILYNRNTQN